MQNLLFVGPGVRSMFGVQVFVAVMQQGRLLGICSGVRATAEIACGRNHIGFTQNNHSVIFFRCGMSTC